MSPGRFYSRMFDVLGALTTIKKKSLACNINKLNDLVQLRFIWSSEREKRRTAPRLISAAAERSPVKRIGAHLLLIPGGNLY